MHAQDPNTESGRECRDQIDNDGDGTMDCEDPDCAATRMCTGGAGGAGAGGAGGAGTRPGGPDDPNTETGRECMDGMDNDGDGISDCDDPDCAAIAQICGDPTCFVAGSEYSSARCCDTTLGAMGDASCWGGGYDFARCCPRTPPTGGRGGNQGGRPTRPGGDGEEGADCSIRGFAQISTTNCPAPKPPARVPTSCPADCATAFSAWQTACADQAAATVTEADTALGGGVTDFVTMCQATSGH